VFNGSRFRAEIAPRIADFMLSNNQAMEVAARQRKADPKASNLVELKTVRSRGV